MVEVREGDHVRDTLLGQPSNAILETPTVEQPSEGIGAGLGFATGKRTQHPDPLSRLAGDELEILHGRLVRRPRRARR